MVSLKLGTRYEQTAQLDNALHYVHYTLSIFTSPPCNIICSSLARTMPQRLLAKPSRHVSRTHDLCTCQECATCTKEDHNCGMLKLSVYNLYITVSTQTAIFALTSRAAVGMLVSAHMPTPLQSSMLHRTTM